MIWPNGLSEVGNQQLENEPFNEYCEHDGAFFPKGNAICRYVFNSQVKQYILCSYHVQKGTVSSGFGVMSMSTGQFLQHCVSYTYFLCSVTCIFLGK